MPDHNVSHTGALYRRQKRRAAEDCLDKARQHLLEGAAHADDAEDAPLHTHIMFLLASVDDGKDLATEAVGR